VNEQRRPSLLATALRLAPLQIAFRGGEALLPLLLAAWFGRSSDTDLYYLLAAYFTLATALVTAAFQDSAIVPVLIEVQASRPGELGTVAGSLLGHTLVAGTALALGFAAMALVASRYLFAAPAVAAQLIALMAVATLATGVRAFYVGLLNSQEVYRAHPIASGCGMLVTLALLYAGSASLGVRMIPLALASGEVVAIVVLRSLARAAGVQVVLNVSRPEPVRRMFGLLRLEATGQLITRLNPLIDQMSAGLAAVTGGGTILRYTGDVASLPTSLLQATLFPVLLTQLARLSSTPHEFGRTLRRTLLVVAALLSSISVLCYLVRRPLCALLFLHGAMEPEAVDRMARILPWALLGVTPFGLLLVLARAHVARQNSRIMPSMGVINCVSNALLNLLLVRWMGLAGIALSTSLTYALVALVFWVRLPAPTLEHGSTSTP
jgi:putative peptidoglycan lipid II flippase